MSTILIEIRRAKPADATLVAATHDAAWRTAYRGIIPGAELDKLVNRRGAQWWESAIRKGSRIAILAFGDHEKELMGGEPQTTNNRMELMAAISALEALKRPCTVDLHTDSEYLKNGITSWIHGWKKNGWRTSDKKPVKNIDLWKRLDEALGHHKVYWHWVKGHAGHAMNERADELAREGIVAARAGAIGAMKTK